MVLFLAATVFALVKLSGPNGVNEPSVPSPPPSFLSAALCRCCLHGLLHRCHGVCPREAVRPKRPRARRHRLVDAARGRVVRGV